MSDSRAIQAHAKQLQMVIGRIYTEQKITGKLERVTRGARYLSYQVRLQNAMQLNDALKIAENMALMAGSPAVMSTRDGGHIRYDFQLRRAHWLNVTRGDVTPPGIGLAAGNQPVNFEWGQEHKLIGGATGSGKSVAMQSILCAIAETYDPRELELYIIDPHGDYADFHNLAHLAVPIAVTPDEITKTMILVRNIYARRETANERDGKKVVLLIDEAQNKKVFGSKDEGLNKENLALVGGMGRGARKFAIRLVVGSQYPTKADMPGLESQLLDRFVGRLKDAKESHQVTGQASLEAHKLSGEGDFIDVRPNQSIRFQVALPRPDDIARLPRAELRQTSIPRVDPIDVPPPPADNGPGRPPSELDPVFLAWMLHYRSANGRFPSRAVTEEETGVKRYIMGKHKEFAEQLTEAIARLREGDSYETIQTIQG